MILSYSIISSIILACGYVFYRFSMAGQSQHALNRSMLLLIYASAILVPIIILTILLHHGGGNAAATTLEIGEVQGGIPGGIEDKAYALSWEMIRSLLIHIYLIGAAVTAIYFLFGLATLWMIIRRGKKTEFGTFTLTLTEDSCKTGPFSWGRYIVMNRRDYVEFGDIILIHEHAHRSRRHWFDIILAYSTICLQWYNPAAWAMREELKAVHEYQADEMVMMKGIDRKEYQMLLLKKAVGYGYQSIANSLNHSKLQKRVTMMYKKKTSLRRKLFALALIPALGAGIAVTAIPSVAGVLESLAETSQSKPLPSSSSMAQTEADNKRDVFLAVEDQAEYPGGMQALMEWLMKNVRYPEAAYKANVQGRVIVKFIIEADGTVTNPEVVRGVSPELDAEALRVVGEMPKWIPAKNNGKAVASYFTLPISFKLLDDNKEDKSE